jgi:formyltetrahydrofolate deformylase
MKNTAVLLITCPDRTGLVARVSTLLYQHDASIAHADQHQDLQAGLFFMRVEWSIEGFDLDRFRAAFAPLAHELQMRWRIAALSAAPRVAILVSKHLHCFADLLYRHHAGELAAAIPLAVGNHPDGAPLAAFHGVDFQHVPADDRDRSERRLVELLDAHAIDLVVLARYMRVLSPAVVARYPERMINVHHSFLPAFSGARPYRQAFARGVKLIGATSHYVTATLDDGPIIEQDVTRISHRDRVDDLVEKGRDLERVVLSRAVKWHLDHRILCYGDKTVVFD